MWRRELAARAREGSSGEGREETTARRFTSLHEFAGKREQFAGIEFASEAPFIGFPSTLHSIRAVPTSALKSPMAKP